MSERGDVSIKRRAGDDCLPACGSVFVFGNERPPTEIRARIIIEKAFNAEFYLDEEQLLKGYDGTCGRPKALVKGYAMYSDAFIHDRWLSDDVIADI